MVGISCYIYLPFYLPAILHLFLLEVELLSIKVTWIILRSNSYGMPNPLAGQYNRNVDTCRLHYRERITSLTIEYRGTLE